MESSTRSLEEIFQSSIIVEQRDRRKMNNRKGGAYFSVPLMAAGVIASVIFPLIQGYRVSKGYIPRTEPLVYGPTLGFLGSAMFGARNFKDSALMTGKVTGFCAAFAAFSFGAGYTLGCYMNR